MIKGYFTVRIRDRKQEIPSGFYDDTTAVTKIIKERLGTHTYLPPGNRIVTGGEIFETWKDGIGYAVDQAKRYEGEKIDIRVGDYSVTLIYKSAGSSTILGAKL